MATHPKTFLRPEQYLEIERKAEFKSEYYQGEMFLMAGAKQAHNLVVFNLATEIGVQLRKRPCRAYVNDMRVADLYEKVYFPAPPAAPHQYCSHKQTPGGTDDRFLSSVNQPPFCGG